MSSSKYLDDSTQSKNPFVDKLIKNLKALTYCSVIKDSYKADLCETPESLKEWDIYRLCIENRAKVEHFEDSIPEQFLRQVDLPERQINLYRTFKSARFIPEDDTPPGTTYKRDLEGILRPWYISNFEEKNEYYRMITGQPPLGEWGIPVRDYEKYLPPEFTYEGDYVHEISLDAKRELYEYGVIDIMKRDYAGLTDTRYLDYLHCGIDLYDARLAYDFNILYTPTDTDFVIRKEWVHRYQDRREYLVKQAYTSAMELQNPYYHATMQIYLLIMVMVDMLADIQSHIVRKDILDRRCIEYIFSMYGVPYYRTIPYKYQEKICLNLHNLLKYKSCTDEMMEIARIFEMEDCEFYKYYLLKDRKMDENGNFIWSGKEILKCSNNSIIDHEELIEGVEDETQPGDLPDSINNIVYMDPSELRELRYDEDYIVDDSDAIDETIEEIESIPIEEDTTDPLFGDDYVERYVTFPFHFFLQRGNIMVLTIDDRVIEENVDYRMVSYNKIRIKGETIRSGEQLHYHFYYNVETKDDDFKVDNSHSLQMSYITSTTHTSNTIDISSIDVNPKFWRRNSEVMVMVGNIFLPNTAYTVTPKKNVIIDKAIHVVGKQVTIIALYSHYQRTTFEKHVLYPNDDATEIEIPQPFFRYVANKNYFFLTIGSTFINPLRYDVVLKENNKASIVFTDGSDVANGRAVVFNYLYAINAISHGIHITEKDYVVKPNQSYQTEFPFEFPITNYAGSRYKVYLKVFNKWIPSTSFTFTNDTIFFLDPAMAISKNGQFEVKLKYYEADRTLLENSNIKIEYDSKTAEYNHQTDFPIHAPIEDYMGKGNQVIIDSHNRPVPDDKFTIEWTDGYNGIVHLDPEYECVKKGERVDYTFIYNGDAEYHIRIAMQQVPDVGLDETSLINLNYPFYPYLQTGNNFIITYGSALIAKERIHMVNDFQITIEGLEPDPELPKNITILYFFSDWYADEKNNGKLIKETKEIDVSDKQVAYDPQAPFEHYFDNYWPYYITYNDNVLLPEEETDLVDGLFGSYPDTKLTNGDYGSKIWFTYIYLIKAPYVWPETREDYALTTDLRFAKIPVNDLYSAKYMQETSRWKDYDPMVSNDRWWEGVYYKKDNYNLVKQGIYESQYNYSRTKYYAVNKIIELSSYSAKVSFFFSALFDDQYLEANLNVPVKSLSEVHDFNIANLILYMLCLTYTYNETEDIILKEPNDILYVSGFNYRASLEDLKDYIMRHHRDPEDFPIWDMIIPSSNITDLTEFINIQKNNEKVYHTIRNYMVDSQDAREYRIWEYLYESLMTWKFNMEFYRLNDGTVANTYTDYLKEKDTILYNSIQEIRGMADRVAQIDAITGIIDDICYILDEYIEHEYSKYIYSEFAGLSTNSILTYMIRILEFFKSYKIVFNDRGEQLQIGKGGSTSVNEDSIIRFYDMASIHELNKLKEYIEFNEELRVKETSTYIDGEENAQGNRWFREYCTITTKNADGVKEETINV